jgi:DNA-binding MarR family transcriptional regulator
MTGESKSRIENPLPLDEDYELYVLITQVRDAIIRSRTKELNKYHMWPRQVAVLLIIEAAGEKATAAEVGRWLLRQPHTASTIVQRMEKQGLVRKNRDSKRKNQVKISLTEKGQQFFDWSLETNSITHIMSALTMGERKQLRDYLFRLRDKALEQLGMDVEPPYPPR